MGCGILGCMDPGWDRQDPALDPRWEAGSHQGSRVGGGILPWNPGGMQDPGLDPGWDRRDPSNSTWDWRDPA